MLESESPSEDEESELSSSEEEESELSSWEEGSGSCPEDVDDEELELPSEDKEPDSCDLFGAADFSVGTRRSATDTPASSRDGDGGSEGLGAGPEQGLPLVSSGEEVERGPFPAGTQSMLESGSSSSDEESELSSEEELELPSVDEESDSGDLRGATVGGGGFGLGSLLSPNGEGRGSGFESGPEAVLGAHLGFELPGAGPEGGALARASSYLYIWLFLFPEIELIVRSGKRCALICLLINLMLGFAASWKAIMATSSVDHRLFLDLTILSTASAWNKLA